MIKKVVGKNIKLYRIQKGFSQTKAASLVGITPAYWGTWKEDRKILL